MPDDCRSAELFELQAQAQASSDIVDLFLAGEGSVLRQLEKAQVLAATTAAPNGVFTSCRGCCWGGIGGRCTCVAAVVGAGVAAAAVVRCWWMFQWFSGSSVIPLQHTPPQHQHRQCQTVRRAAAPHAAAFRTDSLTLCLSDTISLTAVPQAGLTLSQCLS